MTTSSHPNRITKTIEPLIAPRRVTPARNPLVLVADYYEDTRFLLRTLLEMRGIEVEEAGDGIQAIETAKRVRPNLIIINGTLPRLNGFDATRRIRELDLLRNVPIVFLSSYVGAEYGQLARFAGCDDYIEMPFKIAEMVCILERHLFHHESGTNALL